MTAAGSWTAPPATRCEFHSSAAAAAGANIAQCLCPTDVSAELYRANDIESYDTCSLRLTLPGQITMHVAFTHACDQTIEPIVIIETERATIRYIAGVRIEILRDGQTRSSLEGDLHRCMLRTFQQWMRGSTGNALGTTLESARADVVTVNAAAQATPIYDVPEPFVKTLPQRSVHCSLRTIVDILPAMQECFARRCLLSETGKVPWAPPGGIDAHRRLQTFRGTDEVKRWTVCARIRRVHGLTRKKSGATPM